MFHVFPVHLAMVLHMSGSRLDFDFVVVTVNLVVICRVLPVHLVSMSQIPCPRGDSISHVSCPASVGCSYFTNSTCVDFCNYSCPPGIQFRILSENHVLVSYIDPFHMVLVFQIVHVHNVLVFHLLVVNMLFVFHMLHVHLVLAFHIRFVQPGVDWSYLSSPPSVCCSAESRSVDVFHFFCLPSVWVSHCFLYTWRCCFIFVMPTLKACRCESPIEPRFSWCFQHGL